jgi:hypothetical protein
MFRIIIEIEEEAQGSVIFIFNLNLKIIFVDAIGTEITRGIIKLNIVAIIMIGVRVGI